MSAKEVRAGAAFIDIVAREKLDAGLRQAAAKLRGFSTTLIGIGGTVSAAAGVVLGGLVAALNSFSDTGDAIDKMAARTGMAAEAVSELGYAAGLSGTDVETLEGGIRKMQQTITDAAAGSDTAAEKLAQLGVSAESIKGMTPDEQLAKLADGIAAIADPAARTSAAMDVFGKAGAQLIPMLSEGSAGLQAMRDEAKRLGLTVSGETAASAAALNDALGRLWATVSGLSFNIAAAFAPAMTMAADVMAEVVGWAVNWVKENKQTVIVVGALVAAVGAAGLTLLALGGAGYLAAVAIGELAFTITSLTAAAGIIGSAVGSAFAALATPIGVAGVAVVALGAAFLKFTSIGKEITGAFGAAFGELGSIAGETWDAVVTAFKAGDIEGVATAIGDGLGQAFDVVRELFASLAAIGESAWSKVIATAAGAAAAIQAAWGRAREWVVSTWQSLVGSAGDVWGRIVEVVSKAAAALPGALSATWQHITSGVQSAVGAIPGIVQAAWQGLGGIAETAFGMIPAKLQPALAAVGSFGQSIIGSLASAFTTVGQVIATGVGAGLSGAKSVMQSLLGPLWSLVADGAGSLIGSLSVSFATVGQVVASGLGAGLSGAKSLMQSMLGPLWSLVVDGAGSLAGKIASGVGNAFSGIGASLSQLPGEVLGFLSEIPGMLPALWDNMLAGAAKLVTDIGSAMNGLGAILQNPWQAMRDGVSAAVGWLTATWESGVSKLPGFLQPVVSGLAAVAGTIFGPLVDAATSVVDAVGGVLGDLLSVVTAPLGFLVSLWGDAWKSLPGAFATLPAAAGSAWDAIKAGVGGVGEFIQSAFGEAWSFIQEGFALTVQTASEYLAAIGQGFTDLGQGIMATFSGLVADAGAAWEGISAALAIGDFATAWAVAWNGMQVAFWKAIKPIQVGWLEFTTGLGSVLDGALVVVRQSWNNVTTWITKQIFDLMGMIQQAVEKLAAIDPTGLAADLSAALTIDVDGAKKVLEEDRDRFNKQIAEAGKARDETRVQALTAAQAELDKRIADLAKTGEELKAGALGASGGAGLGDKLQPILSSVMKGDLEGLGLKGFGDIIKRIKEAMGDGEKKVAKSVDPVGTFSANAAALLGGGGGRRPEEETAKNTKLTHEQLVELTRNMARLNLGMTYGP